MTDAVAIQLITSAATVVTLIVTHFLSKRTTNKQTDTLSAATAAQTKTLVAGQDGLATGVEEVHTVVNSRLTAALANNAVFKEEIRRLNAGGAPSPEVATLQVVQDIAGDVSVSHKDEPAPTLAKPVKP